jgi:hypothetical protein
VRTVSGGPCCGGDSVSTPKPESMAELAASYALDRAALRLQYDALKAENARLREAQEARELHWEGIVCGLLPLVDKRVPADHPSFAAVLRARAALEAKP